MYQGFSDDIVKFNKIYKLPHAETPLAPTPERIRQFMEILAEEVEEGHDIAAILSEPPSKERDVRALTELSDWLGDIIVYAASEARRAGISLEPVLEVIMQSNFSKLGEDGEPIYDHRGKVMKGPGYWKPEPKIKEIIADGLS